MTAQISAYAGRCPLLKSEPRTSGTCMAMDRLYNAVAKHHKGDLVSVAGNMQLNQWTGQWYCTACQQGQATDALRRAHEQQPPTTGYEGYAHTV
ncbi:hypothetical protein [Klebsiella variicola]